MQLPQLRDAIVNLAGEVRARVTIDPGGNAKTVDTTITPNGKILANEVEFLLKHHTKYATQCRGRVVEFTFTYVVEGEPMDTLWWTVVFRQPNHYTVVSRPVKPNVEYAPK
jgi:hypothetical protein